MPYFGHFKQSWFIASYLECWLTIWDVKQVIMETLPYILLLVYYFWPWRRHHFLHLPDLHSGSGNIVLPGSMDSLYYAGNNSTIPKYNFKNMTIWKWHDLFRIKTNKITILCTFFNLKFTPTTFTSIPLKLFIKMANNSKKWQQIALNCNKKLIENVIK